MCTDDGHDAVRFRALAMTPRRCYSCQAYGGRGGVQPIKDGARALAVSTSARWSARCLLAKDLCNQLHRAGDGPLIRAQHLIGCFSESLAALRLQEQRTDILA